MKLAMLISTTLPVSMFNSKIAWFSKIAFANKLRYT